MNTEFDPDALPQTDDKDGGYKISPVRKAIIIVFILAFWIYFYWYKAAETKRDGSQSDSPPLIENQSH